VIELGYVNVDFQGATEKILREAVRLGYAKTKAEALRLALITLNDRYCLLESAEDAEDAQDVERVYSEIASGKQKWLSEKEFARRTGVKL